LKESPCELCGREYKEDETVELGTCEHCLCRYCLDLWCDFLIRFKRKHRYKNLSDLPNYHEVWEQAFQEFLFYSKVEMVDFT
jgi:hypothetical protein